MLDFCSLRSDKKTQVREVRNLGGGREAFGLVELSRWIVASEWIIWMCTGYLYPDGHVSLQIGTRAKRIIGWADQEQVSWFCIKEFGKDKYRNCLRIFFVEEMKKFGKDKFRDCLRIFLIEEMRKFGKDKFWDCLRIILVEEIRKFGKDKFWNRLRIFLKARTWL